MRPEEERNSFFGKNKQVNNCLEPNTYNGCVILTRPQNDPNMQTEKEDEQDKKR